MSKRRYYGAGSRHAILSKGRVAERGKRNKTESEYELLLKTDVDVAEYRFEPFSLRLSSPDEGQPARYTPDFLVVMNDGTTFVDDVKGAGLDDKAAIVRIKCAAEQYPFWIFRIVKKQHRKNGGGFKITEV